jgi:hypothetical protein
MEKQTNVDVAAEANLGGDPVSASVFHLLIGSATDSRFMHVSFSMTPSPSKQIQSHILLNSKNKNATACEYESFG